MEYDLSNLELSLFILYNLNTDIVSDKDLINEDKTKKQLTPLYEHLILKMFCYFEELKQFKALGEEEEKIKNLIKILKPALTYLAKKENAIMAVRHQIIAHPNRNEKKQLANYYEIAIQKKFPGQYTELGVMIDLIVLITREITNTFYWELERAIALFKTNPEYAKIYNEYTSVKEFTLQEAQELFSDIEARVLSNKKRINRNEILLKIKYGDHS
jgi:hypothetical protein